jgi:hypothetical protein
MDSVACTRRVPLRAYQCILTNSPPQVKRLASLRRTILCCISITLNASAGSKTGGP